MPPRAPKSLSVLLRRSSWLLGFLIWCTSASSQVADFISYGVEEGLSQSEVQCIYQDSRGYLWVGTTGGGVCSFDGISFREYGKKNGLVGQIVNCISEDSAAMMWFGTTTGASRYDGKSFTSFGSNEFGFNNISSILPRKESVWIAGDGGISEFIYNTGASRKIYSSRGIRSLCADENGEVWCASGKTLFHFKGYKGDSVDLHLPADYKGMIYSICSDGHGYLYVGLSDRMIIYHVSTGTVTDNEFTKLFEGRTVHYTYRDSRGNMWGTTTSNLVAFCDIDHKIHIFNSANGLTADGIFMALEDNTHHMWFATREQSLLKLRSETFYSYSNLPGMGSSSVFRIVEDKAGRMWVGSNQDGLYMYEGKESKPVLFNGKPFKQPVAMCEDKNGMWVGHFDGLSLVQNGRVTKTILQGIRVRSVFMDFEGNIWAGTWGKGLYFIGINGKIIQYTHDKDGIIGDYIHDIREDSRGRIWFGTGAGLGCWEEGKFRGWGQADGLCNAYVGSIAIDRYDHVWFHTDACIMRYDGNSFKSYTDEDGLASTTYYLMAFDHDGKLWVGTNKGIDKVDVDDVGRFISVRNYSRNEGFRGIECNSRAVCVSSDGCLWFGTVKGVIRYNPAYEERVLVQPILHISAIRLFLEQTDWTWTGVEEKGYFHLPSKLELDYERNHLTFLYEAINLQNPQAVRYKFMLAGFDSTWQPETGAMEITYTNLPPGSYVFKVKAIISTTGAETASVASCPIRILPPPPPFYARWWFILLVLLLTGGGFYYIVIGRTQRLRRQKEFLEAEVSERTAEISRQNEEKSLMLKEIHHRVKNNLQVISSLLNLQAEGISDKRVLALFEDLRHRVNSMALIHEKMYQSKNLVNVDIRSYIDDLVRSLIDAYDSNKSIHLHTDIEEHPFRIDTIVPLGLILNEIISNSLKYAFIDRKDGNLTVKLRKLGNGRFLLEVSDDGPGIPDKVKYENAESLGMQLIQMLSGQINAKVELTVKSGTHYRIEFEEEIKDRF